MHGSKSLAILLAIALGVGGYAYYLSKRPADTGAVKHDKVFAAVESDKINDLEIQAASGDLTHLIKDGTTWKIATPIAGDADAGEVSSLLSTIASLEPGTVIDSNPASVKSYGLDPARIVVTFTQTGDATPHKLLVGSKTPTGSDLYARVEGKPALFLITGSLDDPLNKTTFSLRDKTVLKFPRATADFLTVTAAGKTVTLAKKGESDWSMKAPVDARADFSAVDSLVGRLADLQMKSLVTPDGSKDLKKYGLDKPDITATIGAGSARASLAIGGKSPDGTLYARDLTRPAIFTVEATLADDLKKKADDFRIKDLFEFRSFSATSLEITQGGQTFVFVKQKGTGDTDTWKQTKPSAKDADQAKLTDLLSAVSGLRAESFVDKAASGSDEAVVLAQFGEPGASKAETVAFRKSGKTIQAIRQGEAGAAVVPTADFDKAIAALKAVTGGK
jgi:hypothetical protein